MDRQKTIKKVLARLKKKALWRELLDKAKSFMKEQFPAVRTFGVWNLKRQDLDKFTREIETLGYKRDKHFWDEESLEGWPNEFVILDEKIEKDPKLQELTDKYDLKEVD